MHPALRKNLFLVKEHVGMFKAANNFDILDPDTGEIVRTDRTNEARDNVTTALREYVATEIHERTALREDPIARQQIAQLATQLEVARMLQRRVIASAIAGGVPTVESSMYKLYMTQYGQRLADAPPISCVSSPSAWTSYS